MTAMLHSVALFAVKPVIMIRSQTNAQLMIDANCAWTPENCIANIQGTKTYLDLISSIVSTYGIWIAVGAGFFAWAICEYVQWCKRDSYDSGRYEPSGEAES